MNTVEYTEKAVSTGGNCENGNQDKRMMVICIIAEERKKSNEDFLE